MNTVMNYTVLKYRIVLKQMRHCQLPKTLRTCRQSKTNSTYKCRGHKDGREVDGFVQSKCLLQLIHQHAVVRLDDVINKGHEEICLHGDLE